MHVTSPDYPLASVAQYTPSLHSISDVLSFESRVLGPTTGIVIVQPSIYGTDNSCTLDGLREVGPKRGRAVVQIDPKTIQKDELREWHNLGVRGVRVNLVSVGNIGLSEEELREMLVPQADTIRDLGWALQLYVPLAMMDTLERIIPSLAVKVVMDHMGQPKLPHAKFSETRDPYDLEGFQAMIRLLRGGTTWVKLSAAYRISKGEDYVGAVEPIAKEILRVAGRDRVVFATDWPHTRFEGMDVEPFVCKVVEWCDGDRELIERVFRHNAEQLWDVE